MSGTSPLTVQFDASASYDTNGAIVSYEWDFDDGSPTASGVSVAHTFAGPGPFDVSLTVVDTDTNIDVDVLTIDTTSPATASAIGGSGEYTYVTSDFDAKPHRWGYGFIPFELAEARGSSEYSTGGVDPGSARTTSAEFGPTNPWCVRAATVTGRLVPEHSSTSRPALSTLLDWARVQPVWMPATATLVCRSSPGRSSAGGKASPASWATGFRATAPRPSRSQAFLTRPRYQLATAPRARLSPQAL